MDDNLITKKELLDITNISYGSLYRWKRKKLIPDEWFIHRATFTGHETFFPREKILARINKILELKERMSLDDIADVFNPPERDFVLNTEDIERLGIASEAIINLYFSQYGDSEVYDYDTLLPLYIFSHLIRLGNLSRQEAFLATDMVKEAGMDMQEYRIVFLRKLGICTAMMIPEDSLAFYDSETTLVGELSVHHLRFELTQILHDANSNSEEKPDTSRESD